MKVSHSIYFCILLGVSLITPGCASTRYLQENESLLVKQTIKGNKKVRKDKLVPYYQQQTNRSVLGIPIWLWFYQLGNKHFDPEKIKANIQKIQEQYDAKIAANTNNPRKKENLEKRKKEKLAKQKKLLKEGNWLMRIGEPPVIYNAQQQTTTEDNLRNYLKTKGYFEAEVSSKVSIRRKKAWINYTIRENQPHLIDSLRLVCADTAITTLLQPYEQTSLIKKRANYDQAILSEERERIYDCLLDNGYWEFNKQYINFYVDTTASNKTVVIETVIGLPDNQSYHQVYHIDSIVFELNAKLANKNEETIHYDQIIFKNLQQRFSPRVIANKIPLTPGQLYKKTDWINSQKHLNRLNAFKYVHVTNNKTDTGRLTTYIRTSLVDRFQFSNELGIQTTQVAPNPFYEVSLKSRNLFKRLETLTLSGKISLEASINPGQNKKRYSNQTLGGNLNLQIPQFLLPLHSKTHARLDTYRPVTEFEIGYTFDRRKLGYNKDQQPDYTQKIIKTLFSYNWEANEQISFALSPLHVNLTDAETSDAFQRTLNARKAKGDQLYRAYTPSLVSYSAFRMTFKKAPQATQSNHYTALQLLIESGGTLQNFIDFNRLISKRLTYYRYLKFHSSYVEHWAISSKTNLVYQINLGIAYPYDQYHVLPHSKYYFAGGASSMRAWHPSTLGPGSYNAHAEAKSQQLKEQLGELMLQGNIELRQQLVDMLEGALFMDAGNIWMVSKTNQPGGGFAWNRFYREIALGTGIGLRLNFKLFILRFDLGFKLYDPSNQPEERLFPKNALKNAVLNIGLGYPF